jgi:ABC-2 type transport system permease protein
VRLYYEIARRSYSRFVTYRAATLAGMATNGFFGLMRSYLFIGFYGAQGTVSGWTEQDALTFVWLGQALLMPIFLFGWTELAQTIRSGDVISDLSKPFDYYSFWLARDAGRAVYHLIFRGIPTFLLGAVLFSISVTTDPALWLAFALSLVCAVWISFGLRFIANLASFWLLDYRGPIMVVVWTNGLLSGLLVPLNYWPERAEEVVRLLPFAGLVQIPVDIILGKSTEADLAIALALQAGWAVALMLAGRLMLAMAVRKVVVQGG